jgi:hypothetical protein
LKNIVVIVFLHKKGKIKHYGACKLKKRRKNIFFLNLGGLRKKSANSNWQFSNRIFLI